MKMTQLRVEIDKKLHQLLLIEAVKQETTLNELVPRLLSMALQEGHPIEGKQGIGAPKEANAPVASDRQAKEGEVIQL